MIALAAHVQPPSVVERAEINALAQFDQKAHKRA